MYFDYFADKSLDWMTEAELYAYTCKLMSPIPDWEHIQTFMMLVRCAGGFRHNNRNHKFV